MSNKKSFTLVELLITIAIIAVLSGFALPMYKNYILKGRFSEAITTVKIIAEGQNIYKAINGNFYGVGDGNIANESLISKNLGISLKHSNNFMYTMFVAQNNYSITATLSPINTTCEDSHSILKHCNEMGTPNIDSWAESYNKKYGNYSIKFDFPNNKFMTQNMLTNNP